MKRSGNSQINRLIASVNRSSESDYSDAAQSDDSGKKMKKKANPIWSNLAQNNTTENQLVYTYMYTP